MTNSEKIGFRTIGATCIAVAVGALAGWQYGLGVFGFFVYFIPNDSKDI